MPIFKASELLAFGQAAARAVGVPPQHAEVLADSLVDADLMGHKSHGMFRLVGYIRRIRAGAMEAVTAPEIVSDRGSVVVLDGRNGIGQVIALEAMNLAVERALERGIAAVGVRFSNHIGMLQYYTRRAARKKCIGFLTTNTTPAMAPWGGNVGTLGNNPWSIAAPAGRYSEVVLDMANSVVAYGKIFIANQLGVPIPEGWAVDPAGQPTTDPAAAIAGLLLPVAGHKGYVASFMMDVLSGVLTGSDFATKVTGMSDTNQWTGDGQLALAMDISAFMPVSEFETRVEELVEIVKAVPPMEGRDPILYPGEPEQRSVERSGGIVPISEDAVEQLSSMGSELGVAFPTPAN